MISQKFVPYSKYTVRLLKQNKSYSKFISPYSGLYLKNSNPVQHEILPLRAYNVTNQNFYDLYNEWYYKNLQVVGQNVSEFSLDLKPTKTLTCLHQIEPELFKIESKFRNRRKTRSTIKHALLTNLKTIGNKSIKKRLKNLRKANYKLPSTTGFKKSTKVVSAKDTIHTILHEKQATRVPTTKTFFKQKKNLRRTLYTSFRFPNLITLMRSLRQYKFKKKYVTSTFYQQENVKVSHNHQNPYNYLSRPKTLNLSIDTPDYTATMLTSTLDNVKSNFTKRALSKLPAKLSKGGHTKWFPHFSRKYKKTYFLRYTNSHLLALKKTQPQWTHLINVPEPTLYVSNKKHMSYYSKNLLIGTRSAQQYKKTPQTNAQGFTKWGRRTWRKKNTTFTNDAVHSHINKNNHRLLVGAKRVIPSQHSLRNSSAPTTGRTFLTTYILKHKKKILLKRLPLLKVKNVSFKLQKKYTNLLICSNKPLQIKQRKHVNKWLFLSKPFTSFLKQKKNGNRKKKKHSILKRKYSEISNVKICNPSFYLFNTVLKVPTKAYFQTRHPLNRFGRSTAPNVIKPLKLHSRINKPFILNSSIMFFTKLLFKTKQKPYNFKFIFKKKLFSFLYPNEVRNALLFKKKQFVFYKLIFNKSKKLNRSNFYSTNKLKKVFRYHQLKLSLNQQYDFFTKNTLLNPKLSTNSSKLAYFTNEAAEVEDSDSFNFRGMNSNFKLSEVKIPRIQFKPGYQRLWRRARIALKESLQVKFIYQQKLSRYIVRFFRQTNYYTFSRSEMELQKTIIYSRLLPDMPTVAIFLNQSLVYLNGKSITNPKTIVLQNDVIQFIISQWYYIAFRWVANWTLKRNKKFKRLVYKKGLASRHKVMKLKKQKSYYTPHWIYLARYDISDIKPYLEVDYLTLSTCIIYNPYMLHYFAPDETPDWRATIYRLYNWKYIT